MMKLGLWKSGSERKLSPRELEATLLAANDLSVKEIAREMGIAPSTAQARLDSARFKLGMQKTLRGLCMEAIRRGVIIPLSIIICAAMVLASPHSEVRQQAQRQVRAVRTTRQVIYGQAHSV